MPQEHDRGGAGEGWGLMSRTIYPGIRAGVLAALVERPRMLLDELAVELGARRENVYYAVNALCTHGLVTSERVAQRACVYSLAEKPVAQRVVNARYVPPFVPRRFNAMQCPFERAALCLLTR